MINKFETANGTRRFEIPCDTFDCGHTRYMNWMDKSKVEQKLVQYGWSIIGNSTYCRTCTKARNKVK